MNLRADSSAFGEPMPSAGNWHVRFLEGLGAGNGTLQTRRLHRLRPRLLSSRVSAVKDSATEPRSERSTLVY